MSPAVTSTPKTGKIINKTGPKRDDSTRAHHQHCPDPFQKHGALFLIQIGGCRHDTDKLAVILERSFITA
jgi:hypothetical protein